MKIGPKGDYDKAIEQKDKQKDLDQVNKQKDLDQVNNTIITVFSRWQLGMFQKIKLFISNVLEK